MQSSTQCAPSLLCLLLYFCNMLFDSVPAVPVCHVNFYLFGCTFSLTDGIEHDTAVGSAICMPFADQYNTTLFALFFLVVFGIILVLNILQPAFRRTVHNLFLSVIILLYRLQFEFRGRFLLPSRHASYLHWSEQYLLLFGRVMPFSHFSARTPRVLKCQSSTSNSWNRQPHILYDQITVWPSLFFGTVCSCPDGLYYPAYFGTGDRSVPVGRSTASHATVVRRFGALRDNPHAAAPLTGALGGSDHDLFHHSITCICMIYSVF